MPKPNNQEVLLDAYIKIAVNQALEKEMADLPSCEELNKEYPVSPELKAKINANIRKSFRKRRLAAVAKAAKAASIVIVILLAITAVGLLSVEASRNAIFNVVQEWREEYIRFNFEGSSKKDGFDALYPSYLPDGYTQTLSQLGDDQATLIYANDDGMLITITQYPYPKNAFYTDNENSGYQETRINGNKAFILISDSTDKRNMLTWNLSNTNFILYSQIGAENMIKIAENMK